MYIALFLQKSIHFYFILYSYLANDLVPSPFYQKLAMFSHLISLRKLQYVEADNIILLQIKDLILAKMQDIVQ